jgi:hypothetical protein
LKRHTSPDVIVWVLAVSNFGDLGPRPWRAPLQP